MKGSPKMTLIDKNVIFFSRFTGFVHKYPLHFKIDRPLSIGKLSPFLIERSIQLKQDNRNNA